MHSGVVVAITEIDRQVANEPAILLSLWMQTQLAEELIFTGRESNGLLWGVNRNLISCTPTFTSTFISK